MTFLTSFSPSDLSLALPFESLTIIWIALPFFVAFSIYLLPRLDRILTLGVTLLSGLYALVTALQANPLNLALTDSFGVTLQIDGTSSAFILTNALVTAAVILYCWRQNKGSFFYTQAIALHGSVNAVFICADFISLYVALEVISVAAFLLITYPRSDRSLWVGLRYLFVSNVAMLFYLMGALLVYQANRSFAFEGLEQAPIEALAFIFLGLLTKGGIFVSGLWLPLTHSESEAPVSALLSGVVVKTGIFPLVRLALMIPEVDPFVRFFGVSTALLGVGYAMFEKDTKRMLAFHTVSQLGFILAAPEVGGFYALTHGLVKAALFLGAGNLPSRNFKQLQQQPMATPLWIALAIASFSISGFPLLSGFGAKVLTMKNLLPWQVIGMNIAALGTAISFAKFIFLPKGGQGTTKPGFWPAMVILLGGLVLANGFYYEAYSLKNIVKPLLTIALGWLIYWGVIRRLSIKFPRLLEQFDHLIGVMSLMLTFLFWMVMT